MAYQPLLVISCKSYPCRRTAVVLFKPLLGGGDKGVLNGISLKVSIITGLEFNLV